MDRHPNCARKMHVAEDARGVGLPQLADVAMRRGVCKHCLRRVNVSAADFVRRALSGGRHWGRRGLYESERAPLCTTAFHISSCLLPIPRMPIKSIADCLLGVPFRLLESGQRRLDKLRICEAEDLRNANRTLERQWVLFPHSFPFKVCRRTLPLLSIISPCCQVRIVVRVSVVLPQPPFCFKRHSLGSLSKALRTLCSDGEPCFRCFGRQPCGSHGRRHLPCSGY